MAEAFRKVGVVGAGTMGHGIAQVFATAGFEVVLRGPCPSKTSTAEAPRTAANPASLSASQSRRAKISSFPAPRKKAWRTL